MAKMSREGAKKAGRAASFPKGKGVPLRRIRGLFAAGEGIGEMRQGPRSVGSSRVGGGGGAAVNVLGGPKRPQGVKPRVKLR